MKIGKGWKLSIQETVYRISATRLVYTDGDGTEHYYVLSGSTYYEEGENTRLSMIESGSAFVLSDEYGNQKFFNYGYLTETRDAYGNSLFYCYDGNGYSSGSSNWKPWNNEAHRITAVYRQNKGGTAEKILTINYDKGTNLLQSITPKCDSADTANRTYHFSYTSRDGRSTLDQITLGENKVLAQYAYHYGDNVHIWEKHKLASAYDAEANYGIEFGYSYTGNTKDIFEYVVTGSGRTYGTMMHGYKRSHLLAVYRNYGKDQVAALDDNGNPIDGDDYLTFKVLSQTGRTICAYTTDALETRVLGSSAASYTSSTNRKANNLLAASAYTGQPGVNLLRNGDAENVGSYWSSVTTSTAAHRSGSYAFVLNSQTSSFYQLADLADRETYTFSGYIRLNTTLTSGGVYLALLDSNTGTELARSQMVTTATSEINDGWQRLTVTYTPSSHVVVKASVISSGLGSNTAYADCLQLEREDAASTYNLVETGSFDQLTSVPSVGGNIFGWYYAGNVSFVGGGLFGSKMAKIYGRTDAQRISQNITVNAPAGSTFLLSGWGKADALPGSVPAKSEDGQAYFGLVARIYYADGTSEPYYFSFNPYFAGWQERSGIMMPSEANQNKKITSVTVVAAYDNNINTAYFDNISLRLEPSQTYRYDENGNPIAATQPGTGSESATYAANGIDLTSYTAANGSKYTYTYNSAHDVTTATIGSLKTTTTYNAAGNVTGSKLTATGTSLYMETSAGISTDRNYTTSVTDANGYTTAYTYDANGQLSTVTNAKGQATDYTYDQITLRTEAVKRKNVVSIGYTYESGRLTALDSESYRNGAAQHQYYYFAYNVWGQPTTTKVGSRTLSTNTYYDYAGENTGTGGNLKTTTYGNNDSVTYSYDSLDRLIRKTYNDSNEYTEYSYNAEGMIGELRHCSIQNGQSTLTTYRFEYDSLGRLVRSSESVGDTVKLRTEHTYDGYNRPSAQKWTANGTTYTEYYTYNDGTNEDGSLKQFRTTSGQKINLTYDKLKRLQKSSITNNSDAELYTVARSYYTSGSKTTPQVEYYNYRMTGGALIAGERYVYDAPGNITEIQESEPVSGSSVRRTKVYYTYDEHLNQLETETRYTYSSNTDTTGTPVTYTYSYDTAGNLLSVTSDSTTDPYTLTYDYGNSDWKDLLTSITANGTTHTIPYDNSGNPKKWNNGSKHFSSLTWSNGRQLTQLTTGGKTSYYAYDANGIRTSKIVDGTLHEYLTLNGKVVYEKIGEGTSAKVMIFSYDAQGRPFAVKYSTNNGSSFTNYFYALNQQGDVVKIFRPDPVKDSNGNTTGYVEKVYATYTYDAWGKLIGITNYAGESILNRPNNTALANVNPLRYRGYYYDTETGFYYLQSRYYDPTMRRFLNADSFASTGQGFTGTNMFAYCGNNPVSRSDITGNGWLEDIIEETIDNVVNAIRVSLHAGNTLARRRGIDTAAIGALFLEMEKDENGIYHATFDCWQKYFGYNKLYDIIFDIGTSMKSDYVDFSDGTTSYRLWYWRGDYINLGAGAEMGIYHGGGPHWLVDTDLAVDMSMTLSYKGESIINYSTNTWWITGFNPAYQNVRAEDLVATYTITFDSSNVYNGFKAGAKGWSYNDATLTAWYTFG